MKNTSVLWLLFCLFFSLLLRENVSASVYAKKSSNSAVSNRLSFKGSIPKTKNVAAKEQRVFPFGNLAIWALKWRLHRWIESNKSVGKKQTPSRSIKIDKVTGEVILARAIKLTQDSIFFQLIESTDAGWKTAPIREISRVVGLEGELLYGGFDFEYFSLFSLLSLFLGVAFLIMGGSVTIALGSLLYLNSIVFSVISLVRLSRHKERYDKVGLAYFLAILSLFLSIGVPLIGLLVILAAFSNQ